MTTQRNRITRKHFHLKEHARIRRTSFSKVCGNLKGKGVEVYEKWLVLDNKIDIVLQHTCSKKLKFVFGFEDFLA